MPDIDLIRLVMEVEHRLGVNLDELPNAGPFTLGDLHAVVVRALQRDELDEWEADRQSWATLLAVLMRQGIAPDDISPRLVLLAHRV